MEKILIKNIQKICQAISNIILRKNLKKEICIGYDNRFMSEDFAKWCAEVFACNNINVELFDYKNINKRLDRIVKFEIKIINDIFYD